MTDPERQMIDLLEGIVAALPGAIGGSSAWGGITGTLADQTDLDAALNLKAGLGANTFTGTQTLPAAVINSITSATGQALTLATLDSNANVVVDPHGTGQFQVLVGATKVLETYDNALGGAVRTTSTVSGSTMEMTGRGDTGIPMLKSSSDLSLFSATSTFKFYDAAFAELASISSAGVLRLQNDGLKIGDSTNGPTITATGASPNESLEFTTNGTGLIKFNDGIKLINAGAGSINSDNDWGFQANGSNTIYFGSGLIIAYTHVIPNSSNVTLGTIYNPWVSAYVGMAAAKVGGTIFDHYTDTATVSTDGTEDDLYSDTTAASTLGADGDSIVSAELVQAVGDVTKTHRIRKYFAGTVIYDSGTVTNLAGATDYSLRTTIIRESSTVVRCMVEALTTSATATTPVTYTRITGLTLSGTNILKTTGVAGGAGVAVGDIIDKLEKVEWKSAD